MELLPHLQELRVRTGRPHWILVDETHHLLPSDLQTAPTILTHDMVSMIYVTVHPDSVARAVLNTVDVVAALGDDPVDTLTRFCRAAAIALPDLSVPELKGRQALLWFRETDKPPFILNIAPSHTERRRHRRKYAEGELPPERSFFFRGPEGKLNLRAQNLILFNQIADGIDDETWLYHLRQADYSKWLRAHIKDDALADEVAAAEQHPDMPASESRRSIRQSIEKHYTLPASAPDSS
jgi:hypothetical protein